MACRTATIGYAPPTISNTFKKTDILIIPSVRRRGEALWCRQLGGGGFESTTKATTSGRDLVTPLGPRGWQQAASPARPAAASGPGLVEGRPDTRGWGDRPMARWASMRSGFRSSGRSYRQRSGRGSLTGVGIPASDCRGRYPGEGMRGNKGSPHAPRSVSQACAPFFRYLVRTARRAAIFVGSMRRAWHRRPDN